jgi:glycosyltransferase involved in cell wall biosynthesis
VVVTCHNYGRYLRECLDSILAQTVRPETIVLVDDASEDDTPAIASEYTQRGVRYERVEYRDVARGRNHGAALCGKPGYLCFVDADDVLPPNYLETLRAGMTDPRIGVTYPHCDLFDGNKEIRR